jgi:predicted nucleotidyltransferase
LSLLTQRVNQDIIFSKFVLIILGDSMIEDEINPVLETVKKLKQEHKISIAILYGSFAKGMQHCHSDIDVALYLETMNLDEQIQIIDEILMSSERDISILRLDDEDESPFLKQEALKGIHLVEPEQELLYNLSSKVLHECEDVRFHRRIEFGEN